MARKPDFAYRIEEHVCRVCLGRVLCRETFDHKRIYRCSNCGVEREGHDARVICCCGMKLRTSVDLGVRCIPNTDRRPELPNEVIAQQVQHP